MSAIKSITDPKLEGTKKAVIIELDQYLKQFESYQEAVSETNLENTFNVSVSSALSEKGHTYSPQNLFDSDKTTAWCEGSPGEGIGEWLQVDYNSEGSSSEVEYIDLKILPGYAKSAALYATNSRPAKISVEIIDRTTKKKINNIKAQIFNIQDNPELQTFRIPIESTIDLSKMGFFIKIEDIYRGSKYKDMCITELNFDIIRKGPR